MIDIQLAVSKLELLGTGVDVVSDSEGVVGVIDVLDSTNSVKELDDVGRGVGVVVVVGATIAVEDVSVELITEDVGSAEVVVTATTEEELELDEMLDVAMEELVLGVVVAIELAARQSVIPW
ncbi:hypothetical protein LTR70_005879 [Exophiala xenobiotica]|uniref:Uncharacterized protein n=1 Tax=Lithohypha guttulata TaxID=1690604 RepID=A0ABR0JUL0_9EURO|nr:hypothetical protein LTR24_010212 [Lithohypha guttulata]KAK5317262.1 hypothetical protein LTR70_005879 [Exophiala xenobiotica]